ncbi:hypothetical protein GQX73_g4884 [Xylaria multiplex]|uniref:Tim44-like domain-containing protein n=1 Tax=Xylaria multiplex TaxID=323545 RepID=A0A7C8MV11_9PEZI|nr:hypothetical protein GQX73_g4884 [Xylaria multiplex]
MAELARIARPWLLLRSPRQLPMRIASPYLGLGYSGRGVSTRPSKRGGITAGRDRQRDREMQMNAMSSFLLPYTIVPPPLWRFPLSPVTFSKMVWMLAKNRAVAWGSLLGVYFVSMRKKGFGWPLFKANKRSCIPAAKALHVQMSEAVALGDKETLRRICTTELFQTLAGAIDSRPPGVRTEWELVRYDNKLVYPRLTDFRVTYQPGPSGKGMLLIKQAVVSISSVQRLTRYDEANGGQRIPGSERERYMTEHLVLQAGVKDGTFESEPWKIWGTLPEMSYETMRDDTAMYQEAMANNARRGGR